MKKWEITVWAITLVASLTFMTGCASSSGGSQMESNTKNKISSNQNLSLEDYLRRLNNVKVIGRGDNLKITIRSNMSIKNSYEQPLFILNGQKMGTNYARVARSITQGSITSVEALPPSQASIYGMEGGAGVVIIKTE